MNFVLIFKYKIHCEYQECESDQVIQSQGFILEEEYCEK
jgi:hypothetical protein